MCRYLFIFIIVAVTNMSSAFAEIATCNCDGYSIKTVQESLSYNAMVFTGRVLSIVPITDTDYFAEFAVYDSWKGIKDKKVRIISTKSKKDCGFDFKIGGEYIVYSHIPSFINDANRKSSKAEQMMISSARDCTQTKSLEEVTEEELKLLGVKIYSTNLKTYTSKKPL